MFFFKIKKIGALTSKKFSFKVRSWELKNLRSLDIFDLLGLDIKVEYRYNQILRIVTIKENNRSYISDLTRFFFDSLNFQRLDYPIVRYKKFFIGVSWLTMFIYLKLKLKNISLFSNNFLIFSIVGNFLDFSNLFFLKKFLNYFGSSFLLSNFFFYNLKVFKGLNFFEEKFFKFLFMEKKRFFFIGFNSRFEFPMLYKSIKKVIRSKEGIKLYSFCSSKIEFKLEKNYGNNFIHFIYFFYGMVSSCKNIIKNRKENNIIFGVSFFQSYNFFYFKYLKTILLNIRIYYYNIKDYLWIKNSLDLLYILPNLSSKNKEELGFLSNFIGKLGFINSFLNKKEKEKILFIFDSNEILFENIYNVIIYYGIHMDICFFKADIILPAEAIMESKGFFFNFFGKLKISEVLKKKIKEQRRSIKFFINSFFNFFFTFIFAKFGYNLNIEFFNYNKFIMKNLIIKTLGLPRIMEIFFWGKEKKLSLKFLNFFFKSYNFIKKNTKTLKDIFLSKKFLLSFFYSLYKISSYTRFSKNLLIMSIKVRNFNFF